MRFECRMMLQSAKNHLERTANNFRSTTNSSATVTNVQTLSKTVRGVTLELTEKNVSFKAGQWVDFTIPGLKTVGGFSITSAPFQYQKTNKIDLAVKLSDHPPAKWIHTECRVGSMVEVRIGGDFYFEPLGSDQNLLLIAGGIGINPIWSIMQETIESDRNSGRNRLIQLLYSAKTEEELIFLDQLNSYQRATQGFELKYFITAKSGTRMKVEDIQAAIVRLTHSSQQPLAFLCGPKAMIEETNENLITSGLQRQNVNYENWY